jgi:hypothetical protein
MVKIKPEFRKGLRNGMRVCWETFANFKNSKQRQDPGTLDFSFHKRR